MAAALTDAESAAVEEVLRATLQMGGKLTREGQVSAEDMRAVLDAGVSPTQVKDALAICFAFNVTNRLANALGFEVTTPEGFQAGAKYLLRRGYRQPSRHHENDCHLLGCDTIGSEVCGSVLRLDAADH